MLRSHLTVSPVRSHREAIALSRVGAAAAATTALDPFNPVTAKHTAIEDGRLPDVTKVVTVLDTVYRADGRFGADSPP